MLYKRNFDCDEEGAEAFGEKRCNFSDVECLRGYFSMAWGLVCFVMVENQTQSGLAIIKSTTVMLVDKWMVNKICIGAKSTFSCFAKHDLVISAGLCFLLRSLFVLVLLPWKPTIAELLCCSLCIVRSRKCNFIHGEFCLQGEVWKQVWRYERNYFSVVNKETE